MIFLIFFEDSIIYLASIWRIDELACSCLLIQSYPIGEGKTRNITLRIIFEETLRFRSWTGIFLHRLVLPMSDGIQSTLIDLHEVVTSLVNALHCGMQTLISLAIIIFLNCVPLRWTLVQITEVVL